MRGRGGATRGKRMTMGAVKVTLGPRGRTVATHTLAKRTLGDDTTLDTAPVAPTADDFAALNKRTDEILKRLDDDAKYRQLALVIGAASALFAAVKLGFIAFPILRARRTA